MMPPASVFEVIGVGTERRPVAYLGGRMRGVPDFNLARFMAAEAAWAGRGWDVRNPHRINEVTERRLGVGKHEAPTPEYLRDDFAAILESNVIALLPDWEESEGARLEACLARMLDMPIFCAETFRAISVAVDLDIQARYIRDENNHYVYAKGFTDQKELSVVAG